VHSATGVVLGEDVRASARARCVVGDVPKLKYRMPDAYSMARKRGLDPGFIALPSDEADGQLGPVSAYFEHLRLRRALIFVDLDESALHRAHVRAARCRRPKPLPRRQSSIGRRGRVSAAASRVVLRCHRLRRFA